MVPANYHDFFTAVVTSAASFIGLLFVAMTFIIEKENKTEKRIVKERMLSQGAYISLVNLFFISIDALIPNTEIGHIMFIMGFIGLSTSIRAIKTGLESGLGFGTFILSTGVYLSEMVYGLYIVEHQTKQLSSDIIVAMVLILFSSALGRAWDLMGVDNSRKASKKSK